MKRVARWTGGLRSQAMAETVEDYGLRSQETAETVGHYGLRSQEVGERGGPVA